MREKTFFRSVLTIALPVGLQSMLQSSFAMVDQLMVGQLGGEAMAAVEVAGRPAFLYSTVLGAVAACAGIMIAQYLGMRDRALADRSLCVNLLTASVLAAFFAGISLAEPEKVVGLFLTDKDPVILDLGKAYMVWIAWTYLPMGISSILSVMIRCMDRAAYPLLAGIASTLTNTGLNYALIFGRFGVPALGITGAAMASVISQLIHLLLILILFFRFREQREKGPRPSRDLRRAFRRQYIRMLLPLLLTELLWSLGQSLNTFLYGHIGKGELAAMSMTGPIQGLFIGALSGVSQAAGILVGKRLGAGEYDGAYREAKKLVGYGLVGALPLSVALICLREGYTHLYRVDGAIQETAAGLLLAFALLAPVKVTNMILGGGILRSGGKTTYIMGIDLIGTWLVGAPLGLLATFVLRLPVFWVYFILSQEELVRLGLTAAIFRRRKWMERLSC